LLAHFKTVAAIREASEEALLAVVNKRVAAAILQHFRGET
jgi:excinuclease UvrABC nuclease subunit